MGKAGGSALIIIGLIAVVIGGILFADNQTAHDLCQNDLVRIMYAEQCQETDFNWTIGLLGVIVGIILLIIGGGLLAAAPKTTQQQRVYTTGCPYCGRYSVGQICQYCRRRKW